MLVQTHLLIQRCQFVERVCALCVPLPLVRHAIAELDTGDASPLSYKEAHPFQVA